jgi:hypothetical protein
MNLTTLTAADFKKIMGLLELKETLQAQVAQIDAELATYEGGQPAQATTGKPGRQVGFRAQPKAPRAKGVKRGAVTETMIELIKGAGKSGITVKELAAKLGVNYNRVFTWFYSTGKKIKDITKVGPGKYQWVG